jgi:hypothetical protein
MEINNLIKILDSSKYKDEFNLEELLKILSENKIIDLNILTDLNNLIINPSTYTNYIMCNQNINAMSDFTIQKIKITGENIKCANYLVVNKDKDKENLLLKVSSSYINIFPLYNIKTYILNCKCKNNNRFSDMYKNYLSIRANKYDDLTEDNIAYYNTAYVLYDKHILILLDFIKKLYKDDLETNKKSNALKFLNKFKNEFITKFNNINKIYSNTSKPLILNLIKLLDNINIKYLIVYPNTHLLINTLNKTEKQQYKNLINMYKKMGFNKLYCNKNETTNYYLFTPKERVEFIKNTNDILFLEIILKFLDYEDNELLTDFINYIVELIINNTIENDKYIKYINNHEKDKLIKDYNILLDDDEDIIFKTVNNEIKQKHIKYIDIIKNGIKQLIQNKEKNYKFNPLLNLFKYMIPINFYIKIETSYYLFTNATYQNEFINQNENDIYIQLNLLYILCSQKQFQEINTNTENKFIDFINEIYKILRNEITNKELCSKQDITQISSINEDKYIDLINKIYNTLRDEIKNKQLYSEYLDDIQKLNIDYINLELEYKNEIDLNEEKYKYIYHYFKNNDNKLNNILDFYKIHKFNLITLLINNNSTLKNKFNDFYISLYKKYTEFFYQQKNYIEPKSISDCNLILIASISDIKKKLKIDLDKKLLLNKMNINYKYTKSDNDNTIYNESNIENDFIKFPINNVYKKYLKYKQKYITLKNIL